MTFDQIFSLIIGSGLFILLGIAGYKIVKSGQERIEKYTKY